MSDATPRNLGRNQKSTELEYTLSWRPGDVVLGIYEVIEKLGEGGMGQVFKIWHRGWNSEIAVKVPKEGGLLQSNGYGVFEQECELWTNLGWHPHIVSCYFVKRFNGIPLVFVELADGGSLSQWIESKSLYEGDTDAVMQRILKIAMESALGLAYAHEKGLVHGDVKPGNILISGRGVSKITDFGLSRAANVVNASDAAARNVMVSKAMTPAYCSPEQERGEQLTVGSDVWSWAVSMLEMLVGEVRWVSGSLAAYVLEECYGGLDRKSGNLDARVIIPRPHSEFVGLIRECLNEDDRNRPRSMNAISERVSSIRRMYYNAKDTDDTKNDLAQYGRSHNIASLNNRAISLIELGKKEQAMGMLRQAYMLPHAASDPSLAHHAQAVAFNLCRLTSQKMGVMNPNTIRSMITISQTSTRYSLLIAMLLLENGCIGETIEELDKIDLSETPYFTDVLNIKGIALLLSGETYPALMCFGEAVRRDPERLDIWRNMGLAQYYDGNVRKGLQIFDILSVCTIFDSEDAIRFSVLLSASGHIELAARWLWEAVNEKETSTSVKLTAAELYAGSQSFLPLIMPVAHIPGMGLDLAKHVFREEPDNLRACVDMETLPKRIGVHLGAIIRQRQRVFIRKGPASHVAGSIISSLGTLTRRYRWGRITEKRIHFRLLSLSSVPAVVTAMISSWCFTGGLQAFTYTAIISFFTAFLLMLRVAPSNRLRNELLRLMPFMVVPISVIVSPASVNFTPLVTSILLWFVPVTLLTYVVWQIFLQRMFSWWRAFPQSSRTINSENVIKLWKSIPEMPDMLTQIEKNEFGRIGRKKLDHNLTRAIVALYRRVTYSIIPASIRILSSVKKSFLGWQIFLFPQFVVYLYLLQFADYENTVSKFFPFLGMPLFLMVFSPWLTLTLNIPVSVYTAVQASTVFFNNHASFLGMSNTMALTSNLSVYHYLLSIFIGIMFLFLSWRAYCNCPEFIPEWDTCDPSPWDIRQILDPLNIRRYAAPWQIIMPDVSQIGKRGKNRRKHYRWNMRDE